MNELQRYAVYYAPRPGSFARLAAAWLGRDAETGADCSEPAFAGMRGPDAALAAEAARYGFHATLRPPFRAVDGLGHAQIVARIAALAPRLPPVRCAGLHVANLSGFLALVPAGDLTALQALAAAVIEGTDDLRAPLSEAEIARRKPARLTARQLTLLRRWGYPWVMEEFRFHLTLTGQLAHDASEVLAPQLQALFAPVLPRPFVVEDLCLFGEDANGRFKLVQRYALGG
ncbi:DUF1045 domain-containing protein [Phaeovulum sp.]|uniref:DUF1045 domain-containing protein n=1 Tax=Phaeovulum sp. TaxID=2934796 RepID=UPI00272F97D5|nr:DUF1045 domain-containing protein [Phaeovulum sp.]MDP1668691.1 DUF1045 domain-containing protein [Phaeovulum sp.]MDZ4120405.1 DUF1045 domain-containing protein [Phaeovulum sp.]